MLRITAVLVSPFMPSAARNMWEQLGLPGKPDDPPLNEKIKWGGTKVGTKMTKGEALFPRVEIEK
jgi:methionyl-tRNA synthetase